MANYKTTKKIVDNSFIGGIVIKVNKRCVYNLGYGCQETETNKQGKK
jgi:hypothetical protein